MGNDDMIIASITVAVVLAVFFDVFSVVVALCGAAGLLFGLALGRWIWSRR